MATSQSQRRKPKQSQSAKATHLQIRHRKELEDSLLEDGFTEEEILEDNSSEETVSDPSTFLDGRTLPVTPGFNSMVLNPVLGVLFDRKPRTRWMVDLVEGCSVTCIDRVMSERDKDRQVLITAAVQWQSEFCTTLNLLKLRLLSVENLKEVLEEDYGIQSDRVAEILGKQLVYLRYKEDRPPDVLAASLLLQDEIGNSTGVARSAFQEALRIVRSNEKATGKFLKDSEIVESVNKVLLHGSISVKNLTDYRYNSKGKLSCFPSRPQRRKAATNV